MFSRINSLEDIETGHIRVFNYPYVNIDSSYANSINTLIEKLILEREETANSIVGVDYKYNSYKDNQDLAENMKNSVLYYKNNADINNSLIYFENGQLNVIVKIPSPAGAT